MTTPHHRSFFTRNTDGTVRVRLKFRGEEATMIEEAAGEMPPVAWLHQTINDAAVRKVRRDRKSKNIAPPKEQA